MLLPLLLSVQLDQLRPTQFAVGMFEVENKAQEICGASATVDQKKIPIIYGPGKSIFLIDRHHHAVAMLEICGFSVAPAKLEEDWSSLSWKDFWDQMIKNGFVYLIDETGHTREVKDLPQSLREMKDDPYRSLSSAVRDAGGYNKTDVLYAEFQWAQFFRSRVTLLPDTLPTRPNFRRAVKDALAISRDTAAQGLPGYLGP